jgi:hypothetical protein
VFLGDLQRQKNDREKKQGSMGAGLEGEPMTSVEPHQKKNVDFHRWGAFTAKSRVRGKCMELFDGTT